MAGRLEGAQASPAGSSSSSRHRCSPFLPYSPLLTNAWQSLRVICRAAPVVLSIWGFDLLGPKQSPLDNLKSWMRSLVWTSMIRTRSLGTWRPSSRMSSPTVPCSGLTRGVFGLLSPRLAPGLALQAESRLIEWCGDRGLLYSLTPTPRRRCGAKPKF